MGPGRPAEAADEGILHATFLFGSEGDADFGEASEAAYSAVYEAAFSKLELPADEGEEAAFVGAPPLAAPVVYLKLPHGYGRTKLNNAWFERKLGHGGHHQELADGAGAGGDGRRELSRAAHASGPCPAGTEGAQGRRRGRGQPAVAAARSSSVIAARRSTSATLTPTPSATRVPYSGSAL